MKILLTGAAGFLGQVSARTLATSGHQLVTTDRQGAVDSRGDLADSTFVATLPDVDWVVHAAAVQYVSADLPFVGRSEYFERNNVRATQNLCLRFGPSGVRFLNIGTSMMYLQGSASAIGITSPMIGQGLYSQSKLVAQRMVETHFKHWATVIPCIIGGPGRGGLFTGFVRSILRRGSVLVPGPGEHRTHMVHVDDVASLLGLIVGANASGFFNAAAPLPLSIASWVAVIAAELEISRVRIYRLPLGPVALLARFSGYTLLAHEQVLMLTYPHILDTAESSALGWAPAHDNARIVRDTARDIVAKLRLMKP